MAFLRTFPKQGGAPEGRFAWSPRKQATNAEVQSRALLRQRFNPSQVECQPPHCPSLSPGLVRAFRPLTGGLSTLKALEAGRPQKALNLWEVGYQLGYPSVNIRLYEPFQSLIGRLSTGSLAVLHQELRGFNPS